MSSVAVVEATVVTATATARAADSTNPDISPVLLPFITLLNHFLNQLTDLFHRIPGSPIILRYIKSSYQNDPYRSLLEVLLLAYAIRTLLKGRTRGEGGEGALKLSEKVRWSLLRGPTIRAGWLAC